MLTPRRRNKSKTGAVSPAESQVTLPLLDMIAEAERVSAAIAPASVSRPTLTSNSTSTSFSKSPLNSDPQSSVTTSASTLALDASLRVAEPTLLADADVAAKTSAEAIADAADAAKLTVGPTAEGVTNEIADAATDKSCSSPDLNLPAVLYSSSLELSDQNSHSRALSQSLAQSQSQVTSRSQAPSQAPAPALTQNQSSAQSQLEPQVKALAPSLSQLEPKPSSQTQVQEPGSAISQAKSQPQESKKDESQSLLSHTQLRIQPHAQTPIPEQIAVKTLSQPQAQGQNLTQGLTHSPVQGYAQDHDQGAALHAQGLEHAYEQEQLQSQEHAQEQGQSQVFDYELSLSQGMQVVDVIQKIMGPQGCMGQWQPDFKVRAGQLALAQQVGRCLTAEQNKVQLLEAGTGVGKTYAYLIPILILRKRVLISTATNLLQGQLALHDIPQLLGYLELQDKVSFTQLMGIQNYYCHVKLDQVLCPEIALKNFKLYCSRRIREAREAKQVKQVEYWQGRLNNAQYEMEQYRARMIQGLRQACEQTSKHSDASKEHLKQSHATALNPLGSLGPFSSLSHENNAASRELNPQSGKLNALSSDSISLAVQGAQGTQWAQEAKDAKYAQELPAAQSDTLGQAQPGAYLTGSVMAQTPTAGHGASTAESEPMAGVGKSQKREPRGAQPDGRGSEEILFEAKVMRKLHGLLEMLRLIRQELVAQSEEALLSTQRSDHLPPSFGEIKLVAARLAHKVGFTSQQLALYDKHVGALQRFLACESMDCPYCPLHNGDESYRCWYRQAYQCAYESDVVVINHALLLFEGLPSSQITNLIYQQPQLYEKFSSISDLSQQEPPVTTGVSVSDDCASQKTSTVIVKSSSLTASSEVNACLNSIPSSSPNLSPSAVVGETSNACTNDGITDLTLNSASITVASATTTSIVAATNASAVFGSAAEAAAGTTVSNLVSLIEAAQDPISSSTVLQPHGVRQPSATMPAVVKKKHNVVIQQSAVLDSAAPDSCAPQALQEPSRKSVVNKRKGAQTVVQVVAQAAAEDVIQNKAAVQSETLKQPAIFKEGLFEGNTLGPGTAQTLEQLNKAKPSNRAGKFARNVVSQFNSGVIVGGMVGRRVSLAISGSTQNLIDDLGGDTTHEPKALEAVMSHKTEVQSTLAPTTADVSMAATELTSVLASVVKAKRGSELGLEGKAAKTETKETQEAKGVQKAKEIQAKVEVKSVALPWLETVTKLDSGCDSKPAHGVVSEQNLVRNAESEVHEGTAVAALVGGLDQPAPDSNDAAHNTGYVLQTVADGGAVTAVGINECDKVGQLGSASVVVKAGKKVKVGALGKVYEAGKLETAGKASAEGKDGLIGGCLSGKAPSVECSVSSTGLVGDESADSFPSVNSAPRVKGSMRVKSLTKSHNLSGSKSLTSANLKKEQVDSLDEHWAIDVKSLNENSGKDLKAKNLGINRTRERICLEVNGVKEELELGFLLYQRQALVIDEAHALEENMRQSFSLSINSERLLALIKELRAMGLPDCNLSRLLVTLGSISPEQCQEKPDGIALSTLYKQFPCVQQELYITRKEVKRLEIEILHNLHKNYELGRLRLRLRRLSTVLGAALYSGQAFMRLSGSFEILHECFTFKPNMVIRKSKTHDLQQNKPQDNVAHDNTLANAQVKDIDKVQDESLVNEDSSKSSSCAAVTVSLVEPSAAESKTEAFYKTNALARSAKVGRVLESNGSGSGSGLGLGSGSNVKEDLALDQDNAATQSLWLHRFRMQFMPMNLADYGRMIFTILREKQCVPILTSATLRVAEKVTTQRAKTSDRAFAMRDQLNSVNMDFKMFRRHIGLEPVHPGRAGIKGVLGEAFLSFIPVEQMVVDSPFDYAHRSLVWCSNKFAQANDEHGPDSDARLHNIRYMLPVMEANPGATLILVSNFKLIEIYKQILQEIHPDWQLFCQNRNENLESTVQRFMAYQTGHKTTNLVESADFEWPASEFDASAVVDTEGAVKAATNNQAHASKIAANPISYVASALASEVASESASEAEHNKTWVEGAVRAEVLAEDKVESQSALVSTITNTEMAAELAQKTAKEMSHEVVHEATSKVTSHVACDNQVAAIEDKGEVKAAVKVKSSAETRAKDNAKAEVETEAKAKTKAKVETEAKAAVKAEEETTVTAGAEHTAGKPPAVLIGTDSCWTGLNLKGANLHLVVIDKLPFTPIGCLEQQHSDSMKSFAYFSYERLPKALSRLKQGMGRLIRSEQDWGVVILASPFQNKRYAPLVYKTLEPMPFIEVADPEIVIKFMRKDHSAM